jgi:hypothetical protein
MVPAEGIELRPAIENTEVADSKRRQKPKNDKISKKADNWMERIWNIPGSEFPLPSAVFRKGSAALSCLMKMMLAKPTLR